MSPSGTNVAHVYMGLQIQWLLLTHGFSTCGLNAGAKPMTEELQGSPSHDQKDHPVASGMCSAV